MSKMSLAGLIFGLTILGGLFFLIGFLAAIASFGTSGSATPTTWASANTSVKAGGAADVISKFAGSVGGKLIHDQVIHLQAKLGGGALSKVVNHIPPSLQPFAVQAQNHLAIKSQQHINGIVAGGKAGIFGPRAFGAAQNKPTQAPIPNYQPQSNVTTELPSRPRKGFFYPKNQQYQQAPQPQYRPFPGQPPLPYPNQAVPPQLQYPQPQPQVMPQPQPIPRRN
jgi:hypothetical protein